MTARRWVVAATAPDQLTAEMWSDLLRQGGIPAQVGAADTTSFLGLRSIPCRVLVPDVRVDEARSLLASMFADEYGTGDGPSAS